jgi:hypothetical protein
MQFAALHPEDEFVVDNNRNKLYKYHDLNMCTRNEEKRIEKRMTPQGIISIIIGKGIIRPEHIVGLIGV